MPSLLKPAAKPGPAQPADPGFVYVLTNAAMPGFVKIGLTRHDDVAQRIRQLDTTSIPVPFECHYAAKVPDCAKLERVLHQVFDDKRVRRGREFFTSDPKLAELIIDLVKIEEVPVSDSEQGITPDQRQDIEEEKAVRAPRVSLTELGLLPGTMLTFIKDSAITCEVADNQKVLFQGELTSLSASALSALHAMGYKWSQVSGWEYWTHNGVKLSRLERAQPPAPSPSEAQ